MDVLSQEQFFLNHLEKKVHFTFVSVPNSQYSEDEGTEGSSKETSPIVPHRKERGRYFNTEQHTWNTAYHLNVKIDQSYFAHCVLHMIKVFTNVRVINTVQKVYVME